MNKKTKTKANWREEKKGMKQKKTKVFDKTKS